MSPRFVALVPLFATLRGIDLICATDSDAVSSFSQLDQAVNIGKSFISVEASELVFPHQLQVHERAEVSIESTHRATLSGGDETRLFFLHNQSKLTLRCLNLVHGRSEGSFGGAAFVNYGAELVLYSVHLSNNHAYIGGAVYAAGSIITVADCRMASKSAFTGVPRD
jgi:hypothetical protein